jgi:UDP-glucose 4-epimerase
MTWPGTRVLVTGADGFIGSHLVERLVEVGASVRAFCLYNPQGSLGWLDTIPLDVRHELEVVLGDIRDPAVVESACKSVDVVFHLAALISIPYSYAAPTSYVDTNVGGTLHVLEAARHGDVGRVVHTSTSEVYGTPAVTPIRETHALCAQSPYAATKIAADQLAIAYYHSFQTPVVVLRPFNTYGPRQSTRAVVSTILLQLLDGAEELSLGRLDPKRDFTYVTDTVRGLILAGATPGIEGDVIQLGTGRALSIGDVVETACRVVGRRAVVKQEVARVRPPSSEVLILESDPTRARERLGWKPEIVFEEGLHRTAVWLRDHRRFYTLREHV